MLEAMKRFSEIAQGTGDYGPTLDHFALSIAERSFLSPYDSRKEIDLTIAFWVDGGHYHGFHFIRGTGGELLLPNDSWTPPKQVYGCRIHALRGIDCLGWLRLIHSELCYAELHEQFVEASYFDTRCELAKQ